MPSFNLLLHTCDYVVKMVQRSQTLAYKSIQCTRYYWLVHRLFIHRTWNIRLTRHKHNANIQPQLFIVRMGSLKARSMTRRSYTSQQVYINVQWGKWFAAPTNHIRASVLYALCLMCIPLCYWIALCEYYAINLKARYKQMQWHHRRCWSRLTGGSRMCCASTQMLNKLCIVQSLSRTTPPPPITTRAYTFAKRNACLQATLLGVSCTAQSVLTHFINHTHTFHTYPALVSLRFVCVCLTALISVREFQSQMHTNMEPPSGAQLEDQFR